ncbi:MAG: prepilin peptidase [Beijerinckiaceae bacterium]
MIELLALLVFPALMAFAASSDLLTMRIPNRVAIALLAGYLGFAVFLQAPLQTVMLHLACGALVLLITFAMFCFGWMGGGDAKLAAATSVWLGWSLVLEYSLVASIAGGALTLAILVARQWPMPPFLMGQRWIERLHDARTGIPYGIALAFAGLVIYPHSYVWRATFG